MRQRNGIRRPLGNALGIALGIGAAAILILLAGYGVYVWQQRTIADQKTTITLLTNQLKSAQQSNQGSQNNQTPPTQPTTQYTSAKGVKIIIYAPAANAKVASPLAVIGEVPGGWSFEASFPIELKDSKGAVVANGTGHVLGEWTTSALVPFSASLTYSGVPTGTGSLVLHKDNPSGQAQNADQVTIPVHF